MNIDELKREKVKIDFVLVKGKAQRLHVQAATAAGITQERIIEEAFKEVYDQLYRRGAINSITPKDTIKEVIHKVERGEYKIDSSRKKLLTPMQKNVLAYIRNHPGQIALKIDKDCPGMGTNSVYSLLLKLIKLGLIIRKDNQYFSREPQSSEVQEMVPKGTKISMMG